MSFLLIVLYIIFIIGLAFVLGVLTSFKKDPIQSNKLVSNEFNWIVFLFTIFAVILVNFSMWARGEF